MAADIVKAITANPIKNGTLILSVSRTGYYDKSDTYVINTPAIGSIENKYDNRFDDVGYYCIGGNTLVGG